MCSKQSLSYRVRSLIQSLLPAYGSKVVAILLLGVTFGLGAYLVYASKAYSYLLDDPKVCVNCHVMGPYYATWQHSSHMLVATCNDCHVPHNNVLNKYYFKAKDGLRHSYVFTMRQEPQAMQAITASREVIYDNCIRCHMQLNQEFVKTGRMTRKELNHGDGRACWDCHRDVPHGGKNSLSSTPSALVPYPESPVPEWLRSKMDEEKNKR